MPRNSAGNYTLPLPPVVAGDTVESEWANSTMDDVGTALTDSLDRHGRGGMLAPFLFFDGVENAPGAAFANQPGTGMWRGDGFLAFSVNGTAMLSIDSTGVTVGPAAEFYQLLAPSTPQSLVNKAYVDALAADVASDLTGYLPITGGSLSGPLTINGALSVTGQTNLAALATSGTITSSGNIFANGRDIIANNNGRVYSSSVLGTMNIQAPVPGSLSAGLVGGYSPHSFALFQGPDGSVLLNVNGTDALGFSPTGMPYLRGQPVQRVQSGTGVTDGSGMASIPFPVPFGATPSFAGTLYGLTDGHLVLSGITATSALVRAIGVSGGGLPSVTFTWIAAGPF